MAKTKKEVNEITSNRLVDLRKMRGLSQKDLARILDVAPLSIGRYERKESAWPDHHLKKLAAYFKVPLAYLYGETDACTLLEYYQECGEAESAALEEHDLAEKAENARREAFFSMCGYLYKNLALSRDPVYMVQLFGLEYAGGEKHQHPVDEHQIIDVNESETAIYLSGHDLDDILEKVHDLIAFECWKKQRKQEQSLKQND